MLIVAPNLIKVYLLVITTDQMLTNLKSRGKTPTYFKHYFERPIQRFKISIQTNGFYKD